MGHLAVATEVYDNLNKHSASPDKEATEDFASLRFKYLQTSIATRFAETVTNPETVAHQKGLEKIEELAYEFMCQALFVNMGWTPDVGEVIDAVTFMRRFTLRQEYKLLLLTLFRRLEEGGLLEQVRFSSRPSWRVKEPPPVPKEIAERIKILQTEIALEHPECEQEAVFASYVGPYLYDVLTGTENGLNVLFPAEGSPNYKVGANKFYERSMTMKLYKLSPTLDGISNQVQFLLNNGLNSASNPVRILEIGAGTGGTTIPLMGRLTDLNLPVQYTFTDISNFFVGKTKSVIATEFASMSVEFKTVDIERPLAEQGIELGTYDIVLAADVFHATEYLDDTLRHSREALKDTGVLVIGEVFRSSKLLEISFGFAAGWWRWGDEFRVHSSPLLLPSEWDTLLKSTGYAESFAVGHPYYGVVFARVLQN